MARGQRDFALYAPDQETATVSDMGEIAARLGSIVTYDRRGLVMDFDNFEACTLKWNITAIHADDYIILDTVSVKSGSQALKLHCADNASAYCQAIRSMSVPVVKRLGFEISFSNLATTCYLKIMIGYRTPQTAAQAFIRVDPTEKKLSYIDKWGDYIEIASTGVIERDTFSFNTIKLVVDHDGSDYIRLLFNTEEYDLGLATIRSQVVALAAEAINFAITLEPIDATGGDVWIDDAVFTHDEP